MKVPAAQEATMTSGLSSKVKKGHTGTGNQHKQAQGNNLDDVVKNKKVRENVMNMKSNNGIDSTKVKADGANKLETTADGINGKSLSSQSFTYKTKKDRKEEKKRLKLEELLPQAAKERKVAAKLAKKKKQKLKKLGLKQQQKATASPNSAGAGGTTTEKPVKVKTHRGHAVKFKGKLSKEFLQVYLQEKAFISKVMKHVPKFGQEIENLDGYLLESESSDSSSDEDENEEDEQQEIMKISNHKGNRKRKGESIDNDNNSGDEDEEKDGDGVQSESAEEDTVDQETKNRETFLKSLETLKADKKQKHEKAQLQTGAQQQQLSRRELKERLATKISELQKSKERTSLKPKKKKKKDKQKKSTADATAKQQFISKSNPNFKQQQKHQASSSTPNSSELNSISSGSTPLSSSSLVEQKTPLRKPQVVKSNGQVVYSKFDFISDDKYYDTKKYDRRNNSSSKKKSAGAAGGGTAATKPTEILKKVEKYENKVTNLESRGKISEALALTDEKKWETALKRAQGEKVRDDPTLLKKTIKKETKIKDAHRKKWAERKSHVELQQKKVQDKRVANIQKRKDEKQKRAKKLQRKKGRIA